MSMFFEIFQNKIIRFFLVSGLNTVFGYGIFALLIYFGLHYTLAVFFATIIGILFNFKTIGAIVFKNHNNLLIFKFFGVYLITYLLNTGGLALFKNYGINLYVAGAILLVPIGLVAFCLHSKFVFIKDKKIII